MALQQWDSESSWNAIHELRSRGTPDTVARCQRLFQSRNGRKRALAVNVMCQLRATSAGGRSAEYAVIQAHAMLVEGLKDSSPEVIAAAAFGCGHRRDLDVVETLIALSAHASDNVRLGVAFGLCFREDERAAGALVRLAGDSDDEVRNWATFGLAELALDTPSIRHCLWRNTRDPCEEVRREALAGLTNRGDPRVAELT
ncbi:HEAT repeat domain-containing protein [Tahibacter caeni]|uniref:HEAT repeat domain-containing protein n=1 Tax=Tahibacter caeni TaxID=1453545 RepID=UPI00214870BE|nr:HEAT repeat domain-containing protein [Tahibacter caeni]